ncbi:MAG: serine/threonine protein kinase [Deltaproteobacteria bacterium]|nr:MAG: serine/threonine protein kinase [Deltaproteobacteria bacterium]
MARQAPQQFGEYHLLEKIATGGMAEVWRARAYGMAGFEKILVIKRVLDTLARDDEFIRLFIDEARIAVQLLHVNIVQVFDLGEVEGSYYMAMEYVHGLDLSRLISRGKNSGPFPLPLALFVIGEVLKALQFAHERTDEDGVPLRIVHCDMSPQNILISYAGEVKITDFGISRAAFQAGSDGVIRGKYAYMSPEQVDGKELDGRSDVFSTGIVLYELLTGRRLFKSKTKDETLARVRRAEVPPPRAFRPEISEDLEGILLKSLARKRGDRYQSAGEMLEAIGTLMVREGHRATNNDLAIYVKDVIEAAGRGKADRRLTDTEAKPTGVVVLASEANPPPRSLAAPRASLAALTQEWSGIVTEAGGEIWEQEDGSLLVVWTADEGVADQVARAVGAARDLAKAAQRCGYRASAGLAPGVARIAKQTSRPPTGWELSGPFYLARWLMNLSAHRGRVLMTEVGARHVKDLKTELLGRISIQGNRFINLYEISGR